MIWLFVIIGIFAWILTSEDPKLKDRGRWT